MLNSFIPIKQIWKVIRTKYGQIRLLSCLIPLTWPRFGFRLPKSSRGAKLESFVESKRLATGQSDPSLGAPKREIGNS